MFTSGECGFQVRFHNGYTLSVQWSCNHHCYNYFTRENVDSPNAEVAILDCSDNFYKPDPDELQGFVWGNDDVLRNVTPEEVALIMRCVSDFFPCW